ncbi:MULTISPECIES: hypothetical protein [unclassified Devosia]|uniref:hypothetical protein n=1 Tax=unclassified Devosia TaxID=196773 RepID=UPI0006D7F707|nr:MULTISPECIES: hypothetical protein [unclassified Devosia]MBN9364556.1 hypothetical protein [Devosia sp.]ODS95135.1 MAG: hypothetical protein ABS47_04245 [Devosia sp. SCN 66-27]OJX25442.1 MAG: hypothetical protein BGO83_11355 [Devosia sp. 66-14]
MSDDPKKPDSPFRLNRQRIVLLLLGALLLTYIISAMLGGLGNYQQLKESATQPATGAAANTP